MQNLLEGLGIVRQSLYDTYGNYVNEKSHAVIEILERPGSVKDAITYIFHEIVAVRQDDLLAMARFFYLNSLAQAAKLSPDPQVLKQIADVTLSVLNERRSLLSSFIFISLFQTDRSINVVFSIALTSLRQTNSYCLSLK